MKLYVGVTDKHWYNFLKSENPDELNFWQPGGTTNFKALLPGDLFLFKLHSPDNFIAGGGFFVCQSRLPLSLAWEAFELRNGVPDFKTFRERISGYRRSKGAEAEQDPVIGCIILASPFFLPPDLWILAPSDWSRSIVQGKTYDSSIGVGRELWEAVKLRLAERKVVSQEELERAESFSLVKNRLGQGAFRIGVMEAYNRRCSMTGERTLPVLQAAHIKPYSEQGPHSIENGLFLRSDLHILFDKGYITVTSSHYHIEVSHRIKEDYENGRDYYALHGHALAIVPQYVEEQPNKELLQWHNESVFLS